MMDHTTRRGFLRKTAAAGTGLLLPGLIGGSPTAQSAVSQTETTLPGGATPPGGLQRVTANSPIAVVTAPISKDVDPRAAAWVYIHEILQRAGLFFDQLSPERLPSLAGRGPAVVLLAGNLPLTADQRQSLTQWVRGGGSLIGIGGTSGLDEVFGVHDATPLAEGWIKPSAADHPLTAGLRSSLHVFGGYAVKAGAATVLAELESDNRQTRGAAILENRCGKGRAVLLAADLIFSIVHIQQGLPVLQDGRPAPDGSAQINDGILKAEDGLVLDWQRDRQPMAPDGVPGFLEPVSDELREIILRSIFHLAQQQEIALPVLWYWPRGLKAVGHLSHDTDGNDPQRAAALLEVMNRAGAKSTWCTLFPGGYPRQFYHKLLEQDFEIGLHYDAKSGDPQTSWSKDNFLFQLRWLMKEAGLRHVTSNKNHYTRWENRLDFFRWCQEAGINSDQTRGPSKRGTIGFPLGGSQPYFPLDDEASAPRFLPVLEVNLLTQDLSVVCPAEYGKQLVDSVLRHHGVAHFLFHPGHILKPGQADVLCGLVAYGRSQGLEWWKSEQIYRWEMLRRGVEARFDSTNHNAFTLRAGNRLSQATLLLLKTRPLPRSISVNGQAARSTPWTLHGFQFDAVTADLAGEVGLRIA
jgi:hypothetical protein